MSTTNETHPKPTYLTSPVMTPTLRIRKKNGGRVVTIDPAHFDPEQHEKLDDEPAKPVKARVRIEHEPTSDFSATELAQMSTSALKQLPEFARITTQWRNKQQLIEAIIAVREES